MAATSNSESYVGMLLEHRYNARYLRAGSWQCNACWAKVTGGCAPVAVSNFFVVGIA